MKKKKLQEYIITEFDNLISNGRTDMAKKMGGYIAIGAFAYISSDVKSVYNDIVFN